MAADSSCGRTSLSSQTSDEKCQRRRSRRLNDCINCPFGIIDLVICEIADGGGKALSAREEVLVATQHLRATGWMHLVKLPLLERQQIHRAKAEVVVEPFQRGCQKPKNIYYY